MIHEIKGEFNHVYQYLKPEDEDILLIYKENAFAGKIIQNQIVLPEYKDFYPDCLYLFTIDHKRFFLSKEEIETNYCTLHSVRTALPNELGFAIMNGYHIYQWMKHNKYCGCCKSELILDKKEFMLVCPKCHNCIYPRINPAVNIAILDGNRLLMAKHQKDKPYVLIAGFVEYGESLEDTVVREVREEVGLKVKNIRYYGSQPWGFAQNIQVGFVCELDGSDNITLDCSELYQADFFSREVVKNEIGTSSITGQMIQDFMEHKI